MIAPHGLSGAIDRSAFEALVEGVLVPGLRRGRQRDHGQSVEPRGLAHRRPPRGRRRQSPPPCAPRPRSRFCLERLRQARGAAPQGRRPGLRCPLGRHRGDRRRPTRRPAMPTASGPAAMIRTDRIPLERQRMTIAGRRCAPPRPRPGVSPRAPQGQGRGRLVVARARPHHGHIPVARTCLSLPPAPATPPQGRPRHPHAPPPPTEPRDQPGSDPLTASQRR